MNRSLVLAAMLSALLVLLPTHAVAEPTRQQLTDAQERLDALTRDLEIQIEECNLRREQLKSARRAVTQNRDDYTDMASRMTAADDERGAVVAELYKLHTASGGTTTLVPTADSLRDYAERVTWLDITQQARTGALERYSAAQAQLEARAEVLEVTERRAEQANERAQATCRETERRVEAEQDRVEELAAEVERLEAEARARAARAEEAAEDAAAPSASTGTAGGDQSQQVPVDVPPAPGNASAAVQFALAQLGKPYAWGGSGPGSYDCSGLTSAAWAAAGVSLPHNSGMQYGATARVSRSALQPGDLVFFGSPIHHVGLYVGNGQMVEAPRTGLSVRVTTIERSGYVGAGRVR